jgi:N-acetylmuramoyl-L-alanine amidase
MIGLPLLKVTPAPAVLHRCGFVTAPSDECRNHISKETIHECAVGIAVEVDLG